MDERLLLDRLRLFVGDDSNSPWSLENTYGLFQFFRPHGIGIDALFDGIPEKADICRRLQYLYETCDPANATDAYFVIRNPIPTSASVLRNLSLEWLRNLRNIARENRDSELKHLMQAPYEFNFVERAASLEELKSSPAMIVYEGVTEWFHSLAPVDEEAAKTFSEAFYSIACDYNIAAYLSWPWFKASTPIDDPFFPYFELWTRGIQILPTDIGLIDVFLGAAEG